MDRWKTRGGKSQRGEEKQWEDQRGERETRKKRQVREKVGKSRFIHCVFLMICGSGGSKSRFAKAAKRLQSHKHTSTLMFFPFLQNMASLILRFFEIFWVPNSMFPLLSINMPEIFWYFLIFFEIFGSLYWPSCACPCHQFQHSLL